MTKRCPLRQLSIPAHDLGRFLDCQSHIKISKQAHTADNISEAEKFTGKPGLRSELTIQSLEMQAALPLRDVDRL